MKTFQSSLWSINLPDTWDDTREDESVTLFNPHGSGSLEITALERDEVVDDGFLEYMAAEHFEAGAESSEATLGDFKGIELSYGDEDNYWREWYLRADKVMLYVTYHCPLADEGREDGEVDVVLETLRLV